MSRPRESPGSARGSLRALAAFIALSVLLTWPAAVRPGELLSLRPDYLVFGWNSWWFRTAALEGGHSPYWTDALHFPAGVSLAAHTLSPLNAALGGCLSFVLDIPDVSRLLLLLHFALSGWAMYVLSRGLGRSWAAALLAGMVWSFNPLHFHYIAQLNQATLEFLPLACLGLLRVYREGGWRNSVLLATSFALLAASCEYYTAYAALLGLLVAAVGWLCWRETPVRQALPRLLAGGALALALVACVSWPLLQLIGEGGLPAAAPEGRGGAAQAAAVEAASNDLLGFNWRVGGEESVTLSWPSLFGYATVLLLVVGGRAVARQRFWLLVALVFFVLGLGPELRVGGAGVGVLLPYAGLAHIPLVGTLLRKPDRFIIMVQLAVAVLCAVAWDDVAARLRCSEPRRRLVFAGVLLLIALETSIVPLQTFPRPALGYATALQRLPAGTAVLEIPNLAGTGASALYSYAQIWHHQPITDGYVTNHALTTAQREQASFWRQAEAALVRGDAEPMLARMARDGLGAIVLHKVSRRPREDLALEGATLWAPFRFVQRELMGARQAEPFAIVPIPAAVLERERAVLSARLGEPIYEDSEVLVFRSR